VVADSTWVVQVEEALEVVASVVLEAVPLAEEALHEGFNYNLKNLA